MSATISERKRVFEVWAIVVTVIVLVGLSRLETRLFELSETFSKSQDFLTTVVYFGLININVVLILLLAFLLFRNVAKLVVERRRGVFGSRLRTKLVATLIFFALAPTILFTYISARFIIESLDEWFSDKVRATIQRTQEVGAKVYRQDRRRLESLSRIALQKIVFEPPDVAAIAQQPFSIGALKGFAEEYSVDDLKIYDVEARLMWSARGQGAPRLVDTYVMEVINRFKIEPGMYAVSTVTGEENTDVVKGVAPIVDPYSQILVGAIVAETRFETQILKSITAIQDSFLKLRTAARLPKLSYITLLVMISLLILFSAVWLGFYVARGITKPIQNLAEATREVALGNYAITLTARTDDEAGQLVKSFNKMTHDLQSQRVEAENIRAALEASNEELDQRRKYMEVVLGHITAGVISVDAKGFVTSVNRAAEELLAIRALDLNGRLAHVSFPDELLNQFWLPMVEHLSEKPTFAAQLSVQTKGRELLLMADAARIIDETGVDRGIVVVFDDATEKVKAQRVAAWREVARRIAHEIKNPVTPIRLSAERLLRRYHDRFEGEDAEVLQSCVETILKQVDSLRDLVNEFSKFARLPEIRPEMANIGEVIEDAANFFRSSYPAIEIDTSGLGPVPDFLLDRDQMNRVFVNIVTNAIHAIEAYAAKGGRRGDSGGAVGRVQFRSEVIPKLNIVRIEVSDNGGGIPEHLLDRVLEPYFSTKDEGTGLGLAIVNQIISDHGGYLRISRASLRGRDGTKVVIELPMAVGD